MQSNKEFLGERRKSPSRLRRKFEPLERGHMVVHTMSATCGECLGRGASGSVCFMQLIVPLYLSMENNSVTKLVPLGSFSEIQCTVHYR